MVKNNSNSKLPLFMQDLKVNNIMQEIIYCIPIKTKIYIVGRTIRNAVYYEYFKEKLPQRDYDLIVIGNSKKFISNLREKNFISGKVQRKDEIVLKKGKIPNPKIITDYVILDIHLSKGKDIRRMIKSEANFTYNCIVLLLKEANSINWYKKLISLPGALIDLKNKQIKINSLYHPGNLFACLRFMSKGFKQPSKREVELLLKSLKTMPKDRFEKSVKKVFDYVDGEKKARLLTKKLDIKEDVFNKNILKK